jgi:hypothetical protein
MPNSTTPIAQPGDKIRADVVSLTPPERLKLIIKGVDGPTEYIAFRIDKSHKGLAFLTVDTSHMELKESTGRKQKFLLTLPGLPEVTI